MDVNLDKFEKFKNDLSMLENSLDSIVNELGWEKEFFLSKISDQKLHICPFDTSHEVNEKHLESHIRTRHLLEPDSKDESENPLAGTSEFFYRGRIPSIQIDKEKQSSIIRTAYEENPLMLIGCESNDLNTRDIPQSHDDINVNFTRDEKLAIYNYAIDKTGHHPENEISIPVQSDMANVKSKMTFAEILAYNRNLKRRRMKYRTTKEPPLSHTEEIRKLIGTQMDALEQYLGTGNVSQQSNGEIGQRNSTRNIVIKEEKKSTKYHSSNNNRDKPNSVKHEQSSRRREKEKKKKRRRNRSSSSDNSSKHRSKKHKKSDKKKSKKRDRKRSRSKSRSRS